MKRMNANEKMALHMGTGAALVLVGMVWGVAIKKIINKLRGKESEPTALMTGDPIVDKARNL